jgi:hypothetical protein
MDLEMLAERITWASGLRGFRPEIRVLMEYPG